MKKKGSIQVHTSVLVNIYLNRQNSITIVLSQTKHTILYIKY